MDNKLPIIDYIYQHFPRIFIFLKSLLPTHFMRTIFFGNMDKTLHQHSDTILYVITDMSSEIFTKINVVIGMYVCIYKCAVDPS